MLFEANLGMRPCSIKRGVCEGKLVEGWYKTMYGVEEEKLIFLWKSEINYS